MRLTIAAAVLLAGGVARAQEPPPVLEASFEAATLKRNIVGGNTSLNAPVTGRFTVTNLPLGTLIGAVYQRTTQRVVGLPDWARDERYDIVALLDPQIAARLQPDGHPPIWALAVRRLLADRAKLIVHQETRQLPVYALVKARADGSPGPNLRPAAADCDALRTQSQAAARTGQPSPYPPATPTYVPCGMRNNPGRIVSGGFGVAEFLAALSNLTGRPIVDRTGLDGKWDFWLTFTPENRLTPGAATDPNAPDLFTALQEQLGLELESTQGPVDVLVVDRLERPVDD